MAMKRLPLRLLLFLTVVNILNFFDRYIVHAVEPLLKSEFGLSNQQSGILGSAFVLGYVFFSPLFGFFGDRIDRRKLMALGLVAWSLSTGLSGFAKGFYSFLLARILVGVGEASFGAIVPSYLKGRVSDTVALNSALSVFYVAIPVGSALGYIAGGHFAAAWGWRDLFLLATFPGLILAGGFLLIAPEHENGGASSASPSFMKGLSLIYERRILVLTILGYILNTFALNGVAMFVVRHVAGLGMAESDASHYFGINLAVTGFIGAFFGGQLASRLVRNSSTPVGGLLRFVGISTLLGVPALAVAFIVRSPELFLILCFVAQIALFAGTAPLNSVLVARAPAGLEAFTQGITIFAIQLFGGALAPIIIGGAADLLIASGVSDAQGSLALALQIASLAMAGSGIVWMWAALMEKRVGSQAARN